MREGEKATTVTVECPFCGRFLCELDGVTKGKVRLICTDTRCRAMLRIDVDESQDRFAIEKVSKTHAA